MVRKYVGEVVYNTFVKPVVKKFTKQKTTGDAIKSVSVGKNLAKKRSEQDDIIKTRERVMTEYGIKDPKRRVALRTKANQPKINKRIAEIADKIVDYKAKGGRVGYRKGTPKKQTSVQKIKKTFGPKSSLGMQSVIYGLDKNPNITKADPKAKFIAAANKKKKNKKVIG